MRAYGENRRRRVVIVTYVTKPVVFTFLLIASLCASSIASAQIPHVIRPDLDPPGAEPVAEGDTPQLTRSEEKRLVRLILWQPHETWDPAAKRAMERLLGKGRARDLDVARFQLHLASDDWDLRELNDDSYSYEQTKDTVLKTYLKLQREILEESFQIEQRLDAWVDRKLGSDREANRHNLRVDGRSYKMRVSPRVSVGSHDYLGVKLRMPYTGSTFFNHLNFRVRHHFDEDRTSFIFKYDADRVYVSMEIEPDLDRYGDQVGITLRFEF